MTRHSCLSGCLLAAILWLVIGLIFAAGLAVGRATASVRFTWSPAPWSALHVIPTTARAGDESGRGTRTGAPQAIAVSTPSWSVDGCATRRVEGPTGTRCGAPLMPAVAVHGAPTRPIPSGTSVPAPLVGVATWYATSGPGEYAAAGPALRVAGWRGSHVVVCAFPDGQATCLTLPLTDWCGCGDRNGVPTLLDLSADAFAQFAPLSAGFVKVTVEEQP